MAQRNRPLRKTYIREWRDFRDLTLRQLSGRVGIAQSSLSRIERGLQPYSQEILEAIAEALSCEPSDLLGRVPGGSHELVALINKLPADKQDTAKAVLQALVKAA